MHPTNPGGWNGRVPATIRLRHDGYRAMLANRPINHDWPEVIKRYWYACHAAKGALMELEEIQRYEQTQPSIRSTRIRELEQMAWDNWQTIEAHAAPILAAWEGGR